MGNAAAAADGQAPARRFGALAAVVIALCACACGAGVWAIFAQEELSDIQTGVRLQSGGATTTGTVVEVEQLEGVRPESSSSFKLTVEYEVNGETYTIGSNAYYPTNGSGWIGEPMPVIYDPEDPAIAQIDAFNERWLTPLTGVLP